MAVPTLDFSQFTQGSPEERQRFADDLLSSFERTGFAKMINHPFSSDQLQELFSWGHTFFSQSLEAKSAIANIAGPRPMRGYTPWRVEEVGKLHHDEDVRKLSDCKEHFDQGAADDAAFPNQWPQATNLAGFRPFMEAFYAQCNSVCLALMAALEVAWGIDDGSLVARCVPSATDLRLTHYPAVAADELQSGTTMRIAPHTDFGPVTLLFQDGTGGLEIEDRAGGGYVALPPDDPAEMIINVGDTLTRWTNGRITGGFHQVSVPKAMKGAAGARVVPARMSMAYLFKAGRNTSVGPLPRFVSAERPPVFPDITALDFQRWRNSIIYSLDKHDDESKFGALDKLETSTAIRTVAT